MLTDANRPEAKQLNVTWQYLTNNLYLPNCCLLPSTGMNTASSSLLSWPSLTVAHNYLCFLFCGCYISSLCLPPPYTPSPHPLQVILHTESCHMQKSSDDTLAVGCIRDGQEEEYRSLVGNFLPSMWPRPKGGYWILVDPSHPCN